MEVKKGNKAVVDLALMQTFLIHYVNHLVLMLNSIFSDQNLHWKTKRFVVVAMTALYVVKGFLYILS